MKLSLHRYLGFTVEDTAWVNSAVPVVDVVGPPIAGIVADKIGNFRVFMSAVTLLNGLASLLLLAVPTSGILANTYGQVRVVLILLGLSG